MQLLLRELGCAGSSGLRPRLRYMLLRSPLHCFQHWRASDRTALLCGYGWLTCLRQDIFMWFLLGGCGMTRL